MTFGRRLFLKYAAGLGLGASAAGAASGENRVAERAAGSEVDQTLAGPGGKVAEASGADGSRHQDLLDRLPDTRKRVIPAAFRAYAQYGLNYIHSGSDVGQFTFTTNLLSLFDKLYSGFEGGAQIFVDPVLGSDILGTGQARAPYRTWAKAKSAGGAGTIWLRAGTYAEAFSISVADNALGGGIPRAIKVRVWGEPGQYATFANPGEPARAMTWSRDGALRSVYRATPPGAQEVHTVLIDYNGKAHVVPWFDSPTLVDSNVYGVWQDATTKEIWLRYGDLDIENSKALVTLLYRAAPSTIAGARLYLDGIRLHGLVTEIRHDGADQPVVMMERCAIEHADLRGIHNFGGILLMKDSHIRDTAFDGIGAADSTDDGKGVPSFNLLVNTTISGTGHIGSRSWEALHAAFPAVRNCQSFSAHDGAFHVGVNSRYSDSLGQNIADVQANVGATWLLGCDFSNPRAFLGAGLEATPTPIRIPLGYATTYPAAEFQGLAFLDTCAGGGATASHAVRNIGSAVVHVFNCRFDGEVEPTSGAITRYDVTEPDRRLADA